MAQVAQKPFHVVVWGATGFTGRLVCEHVAKDYKGQINWAMAGRNQGKLEALRLELSKTYGEELLSVPILTGDLSDQASLDSIASQARVVLSTAGPFSQIGSPVVAAAVKGGAHYVDTTGEIPWVKRMIAAHHDDAEKKGLRIVPCCGYDSIPSDLGALLVVEEMRKAKQAPGQVIMAVGPSKGGVSGGTIASGMAIADEISRDKEVAKDAADPYCIVPPGAPRGGSKDLWSTQYNAALKSWLAPFIMQACNTRVVLRSAALLDYGPGFGYQEAMATKSWAAAKLASVGTKAALGALGLSFLRPLVRRLVPKQGEGPSRDTMLGGHFTSDFVGFPAGAAAETAEPAARAQVADPHRDPGYWGTSRMVLEAALCLALQEGELNESTAVLKGGVLTPASACGLLLVQRLRAAGQTYTAEPGGTSA